MLQIRVIFLSRRNLARVIKEKKNSLRRSNVNLDQHTQPFCRSECIAIRETKFSLFLKPTSLLYDSLNFFKCILSSKRKKKQKRKGKT